MIYKDLLINKKITNQLVNFYKNNKIQNAYIFYGQEGVGKEASLALSWEVRATASAALSAAPCPSV